MEVEAKYRIPNQDTYERLLAMRALGGFVAGSIQLRQVADRYLDTAERAFLRGGFACRLRQSASRPVITLKSLTPAQDALHQRLELEVTLESGSAEQIAAWPAGAAQALAAELSHGQPLGLLLQLWQERRQRILYADDGRAVIELSLDSVRLDGQPQAVFYELEAELLPAGRLDELRAVDEVLRQEWELPAEPRSKFERGLSLADRSLLPARQSDLPA